MELRLLRYFVAVAEELHFARAAERLRISQPPLSRQIRELETRLGVRLFHRTKRRVALTEAGRLFFDEVRATLAQAERAVLVARRAARGELGRLEIGYTPSVPFTGILSLGVRAFRRSFPDVQLFLREMTTAEQLRALDERRLDCGFVRPPVREVPRPVLLVTLLKEPLAVVLPADHPLACRPAIPLPALAAEPFVLYPGEIGTGLCQQIMARCREAGFEPRVAQEVAQLPAILGLVAAGLGVSLVPASLRRVRIEGVVHRPLAAEAPTLDLAIARRRSDAGTAATHFAQAVSGLRPAPA